MESFGSETIRQAQFIYSPQCCTEQGDYASFLFFFSSWFSDEAHFKIEGDARFRNRRVFSYWWNLVLKCFPTPENMFFMDSTVAKPLIRKFVSFKALFGSVTVFRCTG